MVQSVKDHQKKTHPSQTQHHFQGKIHQNKKVHYYPFFGPAQNTPVHSGAWTLHNGRLTFWTYKSPTQALSQNRQQSLHHKTQPT